LRRERIFSERENLVAREQVDGSDEGVTERLGNLNRAIESADEQIADLESQYGRHAEILRLASDPKHRESGAQLPAEQQNTGPRFEARDAALRTVENHSGVMEDGRAEEVETFHRSFFATSAPPLIVRY
jgi:hypothetical protein